MEQIITWLLRTAHQTSGFITEVSVDIAGQGNCEIYVTTSSGDSIPATIYGVKITPDLATILGPMVPLLGSSVLGRLSEMDALSYSALLSKDRIRIVYAIMM